ncbi:MAG: thymidylate synthase [Candidatus Aenigmatarchaeota archaeon]
MRTIMADTIGEAWLKACRTVMKEGKVIKDGRKKLKEVMQLMLIVKKPKVNDSIIEECGDKEMIDWMVSNFMDEKIVPELKNSQSYGFRLFNYNGKDQIKWVVERLKRNPDAKSATITTLMPNSDKGYIPCVSLLDFKIRKGKLILTVSCRAIDFGNKAYANLIALARLQDIVAYELRVKAGPIYFHAVSAHAYEEDFKSVRKMLRKYEVAA